MSNLPFSAARALDTQSDTADPDWHMKHPLDPLDAPLVKERIAPLIDRNDDPTACWLWKRPVPRYGKMKFRGISYGSHVLAFFADRGYIDPTLKVLHHCDNKRCCRPDHLYQGTSKQNTKDIHDRNRGCYGKDNHLTKYSPELVAEIRRRYKAGEPGVKLAEEYGLSRNLVYMYAKDQIRAHDGKDA